LLVQTSVDSNSFDRWKAEDGKNQYGKIRVLQQEVKK
jgi:hypothetical protein